MNAWNPGSRDLAGGGRTNVHLELLRDVSLKHGPLKDELDGLIKEWQASTESYHGAAGSDDMNGNLQKQSAQAKQDAEQHSKATGERTQKAADTSKEAHDKYEGTEDDNSTGLKKPAESLPQGWSSGSSHGGTTTAEYQTPAATQSSGPIGA